ncbi:hypothetical protein QR77_16965 [Streptomyces sp. 150FB]|nr:hypothetical protein QR77_16965 [Streptomyces sp. 150FB]
MSLSVPVTMVRVELLHRTVLLTNELCSVLMRGGFTRQRSTVLFGSLHQSRPSFLRAGVLPRDRIFAVRAFA